TSCQIKPVGDGSKRANPCFACGHNDCLTLYSDNTFHCFSCKESGDVINAEKLIHDLGSNGEAAHSLAEKYYLDTQSFKQTPQPSNQKNKKTSKEHELSQTKAFEIRRMAADFYHAQLLSNSKALEYLTFQRKHSLEILQEYQVGYASIDFMAYAKALGYTEEDLMGVGLARTWGKGVRLVIPPGAYVFPHQGDGDIQFFTFKDPTGVLKFQIKKQFKGPGWICYGQDALAGDGPVVIVEGENDLLSVAGKGKWPGVIATNGNYNATTIMKHFKNDHQGRTFYLCFDNDQAGEGYARKFADAINAGNGQAFKLEIPSPHKDIDEYLRESTDPETAFKALVDSAKTLNGMSNEEEYQHELIRSFKNFVALGEDSQNRILILSRRNGKIYKTTTNELKYDLMLQIAGAELISKVARRRSDTKLTFDDFKAALIVVGSSVQLEEGQILGQGIHCTSQGELVVVNGSEVREGDGRKFRSVDGPLLDDKIIDIKKCGQWIDLQKVEHKISQMTPARGEQIITRLANLFNQWGFAKDTDSAFLTGWVLAQLVQTVWEWRPHMWVTGAQGSGKTRLIQFLSALGGGLSLRHEGQTLTEAGFRQSLGNDSRLCMIDECEHSLAREKLIETLRSAGRGGTIHKGNPNGHTSKFLCQHMVLLASIEMSLPGAADNSRFLTVCTKKDPSRNPKIPSQKELQELRADMVAYALWAVLGAKELVANIGRFEGVDNRFAESVAVPFSMLAMSNSNPEGCLSHAVEIYLKEWKMNEDELPLEDEESLLESILSAHIRIPQEYKDMDGQVRIMNVTRTVSQVISDETYPMRQDTLASFGLKVCDKGLLLHPATVSSQLLKGGKWERLKIMPILSRLPGAQKKKRDIGEKRCRGILIPWNLIDLEQGADE
ncbi:MAG: toprim domain-containing protein, partial [Desulfatibacillum sp.]|nr:toprim domain-containing protein [Desulfatibacillum sp.]